MREGSIFIGIMICVATLCIYFIKNQKIVLNFIEELKKRNLLVITSIFSIGIIIIIADIYLIKYGLDIRNRHILNKEKNEIFEISDEKIHEEEVWYLEIIKKQYDEQRYDKPYIPEGFSYVEGKYDTGFVIQDENKNQYVWVPCTNKNIEGIAKLERKNFVSTAFISKETCYNENYKEFIESSLENGGFYISRFEIGKENDTPVSKKGAEVWENVSRDDAIDIISKMYPNNNFNCELMNGYAYDTTLEWIKSKNNLIYDVVDLDKEKNIYSGRNEYNKIYDFVDNVLELTLETFYDNVIIRGFSSNDEKTSSDKMSGVKFSDESRYTILKQSTAVNLEDALSFRVVLYK